MAPVRFELDGDVGVVVIDNPPLNLFTAELEQGLVDAVAQASADGVAAVVVRAEGKVFSAGVDVHRFLEVDERQAQTMFPFAGLIHALEALPCPTLALANGLCVTAGLEVCLACDLMWAGESARFGLLEHRFAITPGLGGTQRIAVRAGPARAREFVFTADLFDAATLERWNVINRVLPDEELLSEGLAYARRLAAQPRQAVSATKKILAAYLEGGLPLADAAVADVAPPLFASEETSKLVRAFLERKRD
jgi:enoyl-CoA hydratase